MINPIDLLCLNLFDIYVLFLVTSHINVEQFLRSYVRWLQKTAWFEEIILYVEMGLGEKTDLLYKHVYTF